MQKNHKIEAYADSVDYVWMSSLQRHCEWVFLLPVKME